MPKIPMKPIAAALAVSLVAAIAVGSARAEPTYVTGCVNTMNVIKNVAIGTAPAYACKSSWTQITWEVVDPDAPPPPAPPPSAGGTTAGFYVTLDGDGAERTLAASGPLEFFARCTVGATTTTVEVFATSGIDGWFSSMGGPHAAGEELLHYALESDNGAPTYGDHALRFESSIVSPDGYFLVVGNETLSLATRMFGHDCLVIGTAAAIAGNP